MEEFGQVKCNYPSWPWAKDSQSHREARAKHKWVRPSSRIPSEELPLWQREPPNSLLGPGVSLTHRERAAEPCDPAEPAARLPAAFGLNTACCGNGSWPVISLSFFWAALLHSFQLKLATRTCLWGHKTPVCNKSLTSSPSLCVCVCVFMLISRNNKSPYPNDQATCAQIHTIEKPYFADDFKSFLEGGAGYTKGGWGGI